MSPARLVVLILVLAADASAAVAGWSPRAGTLSMDPQGWAFSPSLAAAGDGTVYAVWAQHRRADVVEEVSPRAAVWSGGAWQPLGGRIELPGHEGYDPVIAVLGATPYIA